MKPIGALHPEVPPPDLPRDNACSVGRLRVIALSLREAIGWGVRTSTAEELSREVGDRGGDMMFRLDEQGE